MHTPITVLKEQEIGTKASDQSKHEQNKTKLNSITEHDRKQNNFHGR